MQRLTINNLLIIYSKMPKTYRKKKYMKKGAKLNRRQLTQVKRVVSTNAEHKHYEQATLGTVTNGTPDFIPCLQIVQGDLDTNRTGDRLKLKSFMFRYTINLQRVVTADALAHIRVIFFQWRPNDTVAPISANILLPVLSAPYDFYNWDGRQQYKILYDKTHTLTQPIVPLLLPTSVYTQREQNVFVTGRIKVSKMNTQVQFSGGTLNSTNHIYCAIFTDSTAVTSPAYVLTTRVVYTDS